MNDPNYVVGILKQFKAKSDYENALNEHRKKFRAHNYGLHRSNYVDHNLAFEHHMADFSPQVFRDHYSDDPEGQAEFDQALHEAREEHAQKFKPEEWTHKDEVLKPEYFQLLQRAQDDHDSKFQYTTPQEDLGGGNL